jgi:hypothetical protein
MEGALPGAANAVADAPTAARSEAVRSTVAIALVLDKRELDLVMATPV